MSAIRTPREVIVRYQALFNAHDVDAMDEVVALDYKQHVPVLAQGLEGAKAAARALYRIFPDIHAEIQHLVADDDLVAVRFKLSGTHAGPFLGFEPTHKKLHFTATDWWRVADGKVTEHWDNLDIFDVYEQLRAATGQGRVHPVKVDH